MYDKIVNPVTGRKVSVYGKLGKKILQNYLNICKIGGSSVRKFSNIRALPGNTGCVRDLINCTDQLYPCYKKKDNICVDTTGNYSIPSNFDESNIAEECIKGHVDKVNCNSEYPCYDYEDNKCYTLSANTSILSNFHGSNIQEICETMRVT